MEAIYQRGTHITVPELQSRDQMLNILQEEEYGFLPGKPEKLSFTKEENFIQGFCAGKAACDRITAYIQLNGKSFSFPFYCVLPAKKERLPFFVHINFGPEIPHRYMPTEELVDEGFAIFSFDYNDVTRDNADFTDGLAGVIYGDDASKDGFCRKPSDPGKIALWAWAAMRVMDYAETLGDKLDFTKSVICGHSRLGKTSLLCGALDERFAYVHSNDSGCSGAAVTRGKMGERVRHICERFPFWFCENYQQYIDREDQMPFDQHYLLASIAPRHVLAASASEDLWADPEAEKLGIELASGVFPEGHAAHYVREGLHYFSRDDWHHLIQFVK